MSVETSDQDKIQNPVWNKGCHTCNVTCNGSFLKTHHCDKSSIWGCEEMQLYHRRPLIRHSSQSRRSFQHSIRLRLPNWNCSILKFLPKIEGFGWRLSNWNWSILILNELSELGVLVGEVLKFHRGYSLWGWQPSAGSLEINYAQTCQLLGLEMPQSLRISAFPDCRLFTVATQHGSTVR